MIDAEERAFNLEAPTEMGASEGCGSIGSLIAPTALFASPAAKTAESRRSLFISRASSRASLDSRKSLDGGGRWEPDFWYKPRCFKPVN